MSQANSKKTADLIIFSYDRPMQLFALLESIEKNVVGLNKTNVIYRSSNNEFEVGYEIVKKSFPTSNYVKQDNAPRSFEI